MLGGIRGRRRRGQKRMRWLDGITDSICESEWTLGVGDGQGGLACCDSRGRKESDTTEWLNWIELRAVRDRLSNPVPDYCVASTHRWLRMGFENIRRASWYFQSPGFRSGKATGPEIPSLREILESKFPLDSAKPGFKQKPWFFIHITFVFPSVRSDPLTLENNCEDYKG